MILFDNTRIIKQQARQNQAFAEILSTKGNETQTYNIGQQVDGNGLGFTKGVITEIYTENGYIYYVVTYKVKRKEYTKALRQQDIKPIELWKDTQK